jgi:hypothetical protein
MRRLARLVHVRLRPSPSMVVACAALLVALGGTGVAAVTLVIPRNSVGTAQLKDGSVNSKKVLDGSLRAIDFRPSDLPQGAPGPAGPTGPAGPQGPPGSITLPSAVAQGTRFAGSYYAGGTATAAGQVEFSTISFGFALPTAPTPHFIAKGAPPPAACPGNVNAPAAQPGHLCIYEGASSNVGTTQAFLDPATGDVNTVVRTWGAVVLVRSAATGDFFSGGSWAVTAG